MSEIPPDILGQVYEQFLGNVIDVSPGRRVKVEEKPEVRKAGGVYYTPGYIVKYIVEQTVGKLISRSAGGSPARAGEPPALRTPRQMKNLRILDPRLRLRLLPRRRLPIPPPQTPDWYTNNNPEKQKAVYQGKAGQWFLTTE